MIKIPSHQINFFKEQNTISCSEDITILDASLAAHLDHAHACGGKGKCSTCRVSIISGIENFSPRTKEEQEIAEKLKFPDEIRLACQSKITGNISIRRMVSDEFDMDTISEQFSEDSKVAFGSQQKLAIVFTDIVNYTSFAENFPPYDIVHVLNRYYQLMNSSIQKYGGFISDVAGDGILTVFGMNNENDNSVLEAIQAIKGMNDNLIVFNKYLNENFNTQLGIRVGIHYGDVIVGPFDTGEMKKMAVFGDNVNYASRIESSNKEFNTKMLLSAEAYQEVKDLFPKYNSFETTLKGKTGKYKLYEII